MRWHGGRQSVPLAEIGSKDQEAKHLTELGNFVAGVINCLDTYTECQCNAGEKAEIPEDLKKYEVP